MAKLLLAGSGWGAIAAFNSLKKAENHELHIVTTDEVWRSELTDKKFHCLDCLQRGYDLIICAGWREIIDNEFLKLQKIINIHYSLLPAYRGFHATVWAILNDEPLLGMTIHRMNRYVDDGPVIYQYKVKNDFSSTTTYYMNHFNSKTEEVLLTVVNGYLDGSVKEIAQDKSVASWVGLRNADDCMIDFDKNLAWQKAFFRALNPPYPYPFFRKNGEIYRVTMAAFHETNIDTHHGRILNIDNEGVWISCKNGYVICKKIIAESSGREVNYNHFRMGRFVDL